MNKLNDFFVGFRIGVIIACALLLLMIGLVSITLWSPFLFTWMTFRFTLTVCIIIGLMMGTARLLG